MPENEHKLETGDQPDITWKDDPPEPEKLQPLPEDKEYVLTFDKSANVGGHEFAKGDECGRITVKFGLNPRVVFELLGRLYSIREA